MLLTVLAGIILAIAVSIDGLSVGIIYGMKNIKIPWLSQIIIVLTTSCAFVTAMIFGNAVISFIHPTIAKYMGAILLFLLGLWSLLEASSRDSSKKSKETIAIFCIKPLGLVVKILREPTVADTDISGMIDIKEALLLGAALALDALGAGLGAAAAGYGIIRTTFFVSITSLLFLEVGLHIGRKKPVLLNEKSTKYLPGFLLLALAIIKVSQI
jgi:putative sporulation protein YtaF